MTIEWNKVTWYSKIAAIVLFVGTFFLGFWLGTMNAEKVYIDVPQLITRLPESLPPMRNTDVGIQPVGLNSVKNNTLTLHELGGNYLADDVNIYKRIWPNHFQYQLITVDKFDAKTFRVLDLCWESGNAVREFYAKDKNGVYCGEELISGADPETFTVINDSIGNNVYDEGIAYLAKDKKAIYLGSGLFAGVEYASFKHVGGNYVGSGEKIYYYESGRGTLTEAVDADAATFQVVPFSMDTPFEDQGYAKDKNQYYKMGIVVHGEIPKEISNIFGPG